MNLALHSALATWPGLDSHPALLVALADESLDLVQPRVADLMLEGIARPHTPDETAEALIQAGEFAIAEQVVERMDQSRAEHWSRALANARVAWEHEAEVRLVALRSRSHHLDVTVPDVLTSDALARRAAGCDLLDRLEAEVAAAERHVENQLLERFELRGGVGVNDGAFRRCLESGQLEAARFILDGASDASPVAAHELADCWPASIPGPVIVDPAAIPQPRVWPWPAVATDVLEWLRPGHPAPTSFHGTFSPPPGDATVTELLEALAASQPGPLTERLRAALDAFVGVPPSNCGVAALDDIRLGPLPELRPDAPIALVDETARPDQEGVLALRVSELFAMMGEPGTRRVALLRLLARQLPLDGAIDAASACPVGRGDIAGLRIYLAWVLDLLGLIAAPAVPEVMAWLAGGDGSLALVLLRETVTRSSGPARRVERVHVAAASEAPAFRDAARDCLAKLTSFPRADDVLAAMRWLDAPTSHGIPFGDIGEACDLVRGPVSERELADALSALQEAGLVEARDAVFALSSTAAVLGRHLDND